MFEKQIVIPENVVNTPAPSKSGGGLFPVLYYFQIGTGVGICVAVGMGTVLVVWREMEMMRAAAIALAVGILVAAVLGSLLSVVAATQDWVMRWIVFRRRLRAERDAVVAAARQGDVNANGVPDIYDPMPDRIRSLIYQMLVRHYLTGQKATRIAMEKEKLCTQQEWKIAHDALTAAGIKKASKYVPATFEEAARLMDERLRINTMGVWLAEKNGQRIIHRWEKRR